MSEPRRHVWRTDDNGDTEWFALDAGYHNGPECVVCGENFCEHCDNLDGLVCEGPGFQVPAANAMPEALRVRRWGADA